MVMYLFYKIGKASEEGTSAQQKHFGNSEIVIHQFTVKNAPELTEEELAEIIKKKIKEGDAERGLWLVRRFEKGFGFGEAARIQVNGVLL